MDDRAAMDDGDVNDPICMVRPCGARGFVDLVDAVLHHCIRPLIGASAPGHHGYQRACDLILGQASSGLVGSPVFAHAGKTDHSIVAFISRRPRRAIRCLREIERHEAAEQSYMDEGVQILELARNAQKLFEQQQPREKRRLLNFVLSNCSWEDGEVVATFRQPFDLLAQTTAIATRAETSSRSNSAKSKIWLGDQDSNLD